MKYTEATGARANFAITFTAPGPLVPDGDGNATAAPVALWPTPICGSITPLIRRASGPVDHEHPAAGTTIAHGTSVVVIPFIPGVTTEAMLAWRDLQGGAHTANVVAITNPSDVELELRVVEIVP